MTRSDFRYSAIVEDAGTPERESHGDSGSAEQRVREAEYSAQKKKFQIALALTLPVAFTVTLIFDGTAARSPCPHRRRDTRFDGAAS